MKISIIIPTLEKNKDYFNLCVNSIEMNTSGFDYEILKAENGSGTNYPQGQSMAVNRIAEKAHGEWLLITNDDMYFPAGWDKKFQIVADCFSPNLVEPTDNVGSAPPFLKLNAGFTIELFDRLGVDDFMFNFKENIIENGFNLPFFIKKDLWEKIGGYDEMYDPWGSNSDSDLQYKLEIAGIQPKRHRGMLVYHFSNKSGTFESENRNYWQKNWDYFIDKWGFEREDSPDIWYHNLHIPLDKLKYKPIWSKYK